MSRASASAAPAVPPAADAVSRHPIYFGPPGRALFGWHHAPAAGRASGAVVICPPLGHEYMNAHRSLRRLADRLAEAGVAALRFDYDGTGDSAGGEGDPDRLAAWIASIHHAVRALGAASGCARVGLVGLRMGALLAALAAEDIEVPSLVLWAPCTRGRTFLREVKALDLTAGRTPANHAHEFESGGFIATEAVQRDLTPLDLRALRPRARRVLIAAEDDGPEDSALPAVFEAWSTAGLAVDRASLPGYTDMMLAPHNSVVPEDAIAYVAGWLAAGGAEARDPSPRSRFGARPDHRESLDADGVRESGLRFGPRCEGFGIVSAPTSDVRAGAPAIVIANAGSAHHVGPNRLHVSLARSLALAGFVCLRLDLAGLGDAVSADTWRENAPYPDDATDQIADAVDALAARMGAARVILAGLCSGAHASFHAAADLDRAGVVEALLINPLTFAYTPGMSLDASTTPHATRWQRYRRSMTSLRGWAKIFHADISPATMASDVVQRAGIVVRQAIASCRRTPHRRPHGPNALADHIHRIVVDRGRTLTFVFAPYDPGLDLLMIGARRLVKTLQRTGRVRIRTIAGANHTFDAREPRAALVAFATESLAARYRPR